MNAKTYTFKLATFLYKKDIYVYMLESGFYKM